MSSSLPNESAAVEGAQAYRKGLDLMQNPYDIVEQNEYYLNWLQGYLDEEFYYVFGTVPNHD